MVFKTAPLSVIDLPADENHFTRGRRALPRVIVLHATAGTDSRKWLSTTSKPVVSANRLIMRDGTIYKIVADEDTAYGQGFARMGPYREGGVFTLNDVALSIELENTNDGSELYPVEQIRACAAQVCEWFGKYGYLAVVGHSWVDTRKTDPSGFPWATFYNALHGAITNS